MKLYPLSIQEFADAHEEPAGYFTKGHCSHEAFRTAILAHLRTTEGVPLDEERVHEIEQATVEHLWWRSIHIGTRDSGDVKFIKATAKDRGAYPVTVMRVG